MIVAAVIVVFIDCGNQPQAALNADAVQSASHDNEGLLRVVVEELLFVKLGVATPRKLASHNMDLRREQRIHDLPEAAKAVRSSTGKASRKSITDEQVLMYQNGCNSSMRKSVGFMKDTLKRLLRVRAAAFSHHPPILRFSIATTQQRCQAGFCWK